MMIPRLWATLLPLAATALSQSNTTPASISTDGTCGDGITCVGSRFGECCSSHGYCGSSEDHCGAYCNPNFGKCGPGGPEAGGAVTEAPTPPGNAVTSTRWITATEHLTRTDGPAVATSTVYETSTRTVATVSTYLVLTTRTSTSVAVETSTSIRVRDSTRVVYETQTSRVVETSTSYKVEGSTRVVYETETSTRRVTQTVTSRVVETDRVTDRVTVQVTRTAVATAGCGGAPAPQRTTAGVGPAPSPTLPGTANNCRKYYQTRQGDTCRRIAERNDISQQQLKGWNTDLDQVINIVDGLLCIPLLSGILGGSRCEGGATLRVDCGNLPASYYICVEA